MSAVPAPIRVHPGIKLTRWTLLIAGIYYGNARYEKLAAAEVEIREEERKQKVIRDAEIAEEKRIASERDVAMLASLADPVPPKN